MSTAGRALSRASTGGARAAGRRRRAQGRPADGAGLAARGPRPPAGARRAARCWPSTASGSRCARRSSPAARARARRTRKPHNAAREGFLADLLDHLAGQLAGAMRTDADQDNRADLLDELRDSADVRRELNLTWMPLTPERLLRRALLADPERLAAAAPRPVARGARPAAARPRRAVDGGRRAAARRAGRAARRRHDAGDRGRARRAARAQRAEDVRQRAGRAAATSTPLIRPSPPSCSPTGSPTAGPSLTVAERAETDRTWAFGHVVVDEAQELSPMMWRLLMRRCPSRSMTLVGDVAQVGLGGRARRPGARCSTATSTGRWRLEPAHRQLPHAGAGHAARDRRARRPPACRRRRPSRSARATGSRWRRRSAAATRRAVADAVRAELERSARGGSRS